MLKAADVLMGDIEFEAVNPTGDSYRFKIARTPVLDMLSALTVGSIQFAPKRKRRQIKTIATIDCLEKTVYPSQNAYNPPYFKAARVALWALKLILEDQDPPHGYKIRQIES